MSSKEACLEPAHRQGEAFSRGAVPSRQGFDGPGHHVLGLRGEAGELTAPVRLLLYSGPLCECEKINPQL